MLVAGRAWDGLSRQIVGWLGYLYLTFPHLFPPLLTFPSTSEFLLLPAFISFKGASALFKRSILKRTIHLVLKASVSSLTADTSLSAVWRNVYKLNGKHHISLTGNTLSLTLQFLVQNTSIAPDTLGSRFSQIGERSHLAPQFQTLKSTNECHPVILFREGPDHIHYLLLKHLPPSSLTLLLVLFNHVWTKDPSCREALILPFLKPGKSGSPGLLPSDCLGQLSM